MTVNQLATKYRPQTFDEVVGQTLSVQALKGMVESKDLPSGLLFSGASGSGKTTLARIVASELEADVIEVDAASNSGVDNIRKLNEQLRYTTGGAYKVLIIDECHALSNAAFQALLKSLEEATDGVLYILVTTEPHKVPKTVRTRLIEFDFRPLTPVEILTRMVQVLKTEGFTPNPELVKYIATNSDGSVRSALTSLGMVISANIDSVEEFAEMSSEVDVSAQVLKSMTDKDIEAMYSKIDEALLSVSGASVLVDQITATLRDLLILRATTETTISVDLPMKKDLARILHPERVFAMLRILWDLKTQVKSRGDQKVDVELACALLYDLVNR